MSKYKFTAEEKIEISEEINYREGTIEDWLIRFGVSVYTYYQ